MAIVKQLVQVMPGHRVELVVPEVADGDWVEVVVHSHRIASEPNADVLALIDSLPDRPRTASDWQLYEDQLRQDRESWGP